jgi:hypothetical protein
LLSFEKVQEVEDLTCIYARIYIIGWLSSAWKVSTSLSTFIVVFAID